MQGAGAQSYQAAGAVLQPSGGCTAVQQPCSQARLGRNVVQACC